MKNKEKLLKRIEQTESELEKLKAELNEPKDKMPDVPFWGICNGRLYRAINQNTNFQGGYDFDKLNSNPTDEYVKGVILNPSNIAKPEEIKAHLIKLAKEKYSEGDEVKNLSKSVLQSKSGKIDYSGSNYVPSHDELWVGVKGAYHRICVYKRGEWAEKVGLPKFEELVDFGIIDFLEAHGYHKAATLAKLQSVADYVNDGWVADFENRDDKWQLGYEFYYDEFCDANSEHDTSTGTPSFKSEEAMNKAVEIFRHNNAEQELIDFFK